MSWVERVRKVLNKDVRELVPRQRVGGAATTPRSAPEAAAVSGGPSGTGMTPEAAPPSARAETPPPKQTWTELLNTPVSRLGRGKGPAVEGNTALEPEPEPGSDAAALSMLRSGDRIAETYEVRRVLSRSSGTVVYLARHLNWGTDVALRAPVPDGLEKPPSPRAMSELMAPWTALGLHPHIAYGHYVHTVDGAPVVVVEYVEGGNLRSWIADGRTATLRAGLNVAIQICHALEYLHAAGLIHGALKPENILVAPDGTAKITDVQIAGWGTPPTQPSGPTPAPGNNAAARNRATAAAYVAPEQWVAAEQKDGRTDVFALGVCLYEMFCGGRPYEVTRGPRREAPDARAQSEQQLPEELSTLLRQCVDWERESRPSATQALNRLCEIYASRFGKPSAFADVAPTPVEADGWNNRGLAAGFFSQHDEAVSAWDAAIGIDPQHVEATYNRGVSLWRLARATDEEVIQQLARARAGAQPWKVRYLLALVHLESGQIEIATELLEEAARENPDHPDIAAALELARSDKIRAARPLRAFQGHAGYVSATCFSADGRHVYSAGADQSVRQWDTETGRCVRTFDGHTRHVASVDVTADGRLLLTSSDDGSMRVWDTATGRCIQVVDLGAERVFSASLSGDGRVAACAFSSSAYGASGTGVEIWDLSAKRKRGTLTGHAAATKNVSLSPDGQWAVSGGDDKTVRLWDANSTREVKLFQGHLHFVSAVAISPDGQWVVSGSWDKTIRLWDLASGRCVRLLIGHSGLVNSVRMSRDSRWILSGGWDGTVRLWEAATGRCLRTFAGHSSMVSTVAFSPTTGLAASGSWDRTIRLYQVPERPTLVCTHQLSESWRYDFTAARQKGDDSLEELLGRVRIALDEGSDDTALELMRRCRPLVRPSEGEEAVDEAHRLWRQLSRLMPRTDLRDVRMERTLALPDVVFAGDLNGDARQILTAGRDQVLRLWDTATGECARSFNGHSDRVLAARLRADGRQALSGGGDQMLRLWDTTTGETLMTLNGHSSAVTSVCFGPDGRSAVSGSYDHSVRLWDLTSGKCFQAFNGHTRQVTSVAITADGLRIVSGAHDNSVRLWEVRSGRCLRSLEGHQRPVTSVSLSPDGGWALSASQDRSIRLWDLRSGRCIRTLEGHEDTVSAVQFSPDGRWAFSASWDQTIRVWDLGSGRCWGQLEGYRDRLMSLCLSADGLWLLSGCADKTARLWELDWELEAPGTN